MAKVKTNPIIEQLRGKVGDLVFKRLVEGDISHVGMWIGNGWIIESEAWVGSVILRPLVEFKKASAKNIYAGMRELKG